MKRKVIAFCGKAGCVDKDTEFLTKSGWKKISEYDGESIGVYHSNGDLSFEIPSNFIVDSASEWLYLSTKYGINQKVSPEHNVYYITSKGNLYHKSAEEVFKDQQSTSAGFKGKFITTFNKLCGIPIPLTDDQIRLHIAFQADGRQLKFKDSVVFNLKKSRKKERLEKLLNSCDIPFTYTDGKKGNTNEGYRTYRFHLPNAFKEFPKSWWQMPKDQLKIVLEEISFWDGHWKLYNEKSKPNYFTNIKQNADFVQFVMANFGFRSGIHYDIHRVNTNYEVCGTKQNLINTGSYKGNIKKESAKSGEKKYCFTTSTGMWVARRKDCIFITGNSGKDFSAQRLLKTKGYKVVAYADALRDVAFQVIGIPFEAGMKRYDELKQTKIVNGLTFRNILENLGSGIRRYDKDFWARTVLNFIENCVENVAISDLRYPNEYTIIKEYCDKNGIDFKLVFCDYHSDRYQEDNPHESAHLASYLKNLGYKDQEYVDEYDMQVYINMENSTDAKYAPKRN